MAMAFAPTAGAQTVFPQSDGSGANIGDGCPAGEFGAIPAGSLGEGGFACFGTQEEAAYYAETGQLLPEDQAAPQQPATPTDNNAGTAQYDDEMNELPSTGGPALLLPIAGFSMMALGGFFLKRRLN